MSEPTGRGPAYRIETPRLVIRCWSPADAPLLAAAIEANVEHLRPWVPWARGEPPALDVRIDLLRKFRAEFDLGHDYVYGIFDPDEREVIGGTGLHARAGAGAREIGYWIGKAHTHQGLATEAAAALTKTGFLHEKLDRVEIHCDPLNTASAGVPRRLGFTHEATLRRRIPGGSDDERRDSMIWTMFAADFPASPCAGAELRAFDAAGRQL
jgi:RimJ/RimL family protein N-acetyltransferase